MSSLLLPVLLATAAQAAQPSLASRSLTADEEAVPTTGVRAEDVGPRKVRFEVSFRTRYLVAPAAIISAFGFEDDTEDYNWGLRDTSDYCQATPTSEACGNARPVPRGMSYGFEFLTKFNRDSVLFYFDYVDSDMEAGYWDDREEGDRPDDSDDGDFLRPGANFGVVAVGVNYQADVPLVKLSKTKNIFGLDFTAGAGLGLLALVGDLDRWDSTGALVPSYEQFDRGDAPLADGEVGRFWPAVDINLGFKLNFGDRVVVRLEGGLHTLLYFGGTVGLKF